MTAVAEKVMESAMGLSPVDRAELIERLFVSFDKTANHSMDEAWFFCSRDPWIAVFESV